ncbi:MAG TPA: hypothetical protein VFK18_00445 [Luteimonas sp.]|nr:hypothetical protein [Luteimonas sp.]
MNEFEAYLAALARALPRHGRDARVAELRSDLEAELESALQVEPHADRGELMRRIVAGREDPVALAGHMAPRASALVGGAAYPVYRLALGLSLCTSLALVLVLTLALDGWTGANAWMRLSGLVTAAIIVFCVVTLSFAAMDRLGFAFGNVDVRALRRPVSARVRGFGTPTLVLALGVAVAVCGFPGQVGLPLLVDQPGWRVVLFPVLSDMLRGIPQWLVGLWTTGVALAWSAQRLGMVQARGIGWLAQAVRLCGLVAWGWILARTPVFAIPDATTLQVLPPDLRAAMTDTIAPVLFPLLRGVMWLGLILHTVRFVRETRQA